MNAFWSNLGASYLYLYSFLICSKVIFKSVFLDEVGLNVTFINVFLGTLLGLNAEFNEAPFKLFLFIGIIR